MKKAKWQKLLLRLGVIGMLLGFGGIFANVLFSANAETEYAEGSYTFVSQSGSYAEYIEQHADIPHGAESVYIGHDAIQSLGSDIKVQDGNALLFGKGESYVEYTVSVPADGMYYLALDYAVTEGTNRAIKVGAAVNGEYPFTEAKEVNVPRIYQNTTEIRLDSIGNEVAPKQDYVYDWQKHTLMNTYGYFDGAYCFYLKQGTNTIGITGSGTEFLLRGIELVPAKELITYAEYLQQTKGADSAGQLIKIQAETAIYKSDSVLYPNYDRINLATEGSTGELNHAKYIRVNTIGGNLWNTTGQWISWEVEIPADGYYELGCKFRQNYLDGLFTSRAVYIDGELPFEELGRVRFIYDDDWQSMTFADENGEPFKVYLTKGTHEIKMMCTMGEFADTLRAINDCVFRVNELYRQIIMITSTSPDRYTDYFLEQRVPNLIATMQECSEVLSREVEKISDMVGGGRSSKTAVLETLRVQLDSFIEDTEEIPLRLSGFKNNISAVGSWLVDIQAQGLQLDYLYVKSPDTEAPKDETNFFSNAWYSISRFFASFDDSTLSIGGAGGKGDNRITVWLSGTGRDQAQVIKDLIDESFTPDHDIIVDLQLVQGSLIEATLAGMGPDVALMVAEDQPVNFAMRGALYDLSEFDDYEEVLGRFHESAVTPFWYNGGLYALPDTQVFNMLFYRTDVFEELGIKAPQTWEEFYNILPVIQRNNLQITVQDIFATLLLQNGGSYYNEDGTASLLDSQIAIDAMTTYTDLYVKYGFEVKTDFYSRFRSGELVMSIQPYNLYNQLMVAAPEINGLWAMVPIPGIKQADGTINNSQNATVTGTVMLDSCENKEAAWEFMKWWSSDEVKAKYAVQLEGILGASARFTPANTGTISLLPWSDTELAQLNAAWDGVIGIPQLPGSYYVSRGLTNAFRSVVYNGDFPRYAMTLQTKYINEEITRKREEFGLSTAKEESGR